MRPDQITGLIVLNLAANFCFGQAYWYKSYAGAVDQDSITIHLNKTGHEYTGYYYYNPDQSPVYFTGDDTSETAKIRLVSSLARQDSEEYFVFSINANVINGYRHNSGKGADAPFSAQQISMPLEFDFVHVEGSVKLLPAMKETPIGTFRAAAVWPRGISGREMFLKKIIDEIVGEKNSTEDIRTIFLRSKKKFLDGYLKENKSVKATEIKDDSYMYDMDQTVELTIAYQSAKLLTLSDFTYSYTGGAHGSYGTIFIPIDLTNSKRITIDDVVTASGKKQFPALLEKYFRKAYGLNDGDSLTTAGLFDNKISPNNNFYLTSKGIGFEYNPYEIGPFALGEIMVFIPFTELKDDLRPEFKKLID